jgi:hypothetical protein
VRYTIEQKAGLVYLIPRIDLAVTTRRNTTSSQSIRGLPSHVQWRSWAHAFREVISWNWPVHFQLANGHCEPNKGSHVGRTELVVAFSVLVLYIDATTNGSETPKSMGGGLGPDFIERHREPPGCSEVTKLIGAVAQLGERLVRNEEAVGSIPISSTRNLSTSGSKDARGNGRHLTLFMFFVPLLLRIQKS